MTMLKRVLPVQISTLADDEVEVVMSTGTVARDGHILVPQGAILDNYRSNPVVLWQHDPDAPIARASNIRVAGNEITATVTFAPSGVSPKADEIRGLVKGSIINAVSVGFDPIDGVPLDPKRPRGGQRFTTWELLELSFVSVPADTGAVVTARDLEREQMTEQNRAAEASAITEQPAVNDNAASQSPANDNGTGVETTLKKRSLYGVAQLAYALMDLGWIQECAAFESSLEGDASEVPGLLLAAVKQAGAALIAMTVEEVNELIAGDDAGEDEIELGERYLRAAREVRARLDRDDLGGGGGSNVRDDEGGEETMAASVAMAREGLAHLQAADEHHRAGRAAHRRAADCMRSLIDPEAPANDNVDPEDAKRALKNLTPEAVKLAERLRALALKGQLHDRLVTVLTGENAA